MLRKGLTIAIAGILLGVIGTVLKAPDASAETLWALQRKLPNPPGVTCGPSAQCPSGYGSAYAWDAQPATSSTDPSDYSCRATTKYYADRNPGVDLYAYRFNAVNESYSGRPPASFVTLMWLSAKGEPWRSFGVELTQGGQPYVDLQINAVIFVCGGLVLPHTGAQLSDSGTPQQLNAASGYWLPKLPQLTGTTVDSRVDNPVNTNSTPAALQSRLTGASQQITSFAVRTSGNGLSGVIAAPGSSISTGQVPTSYASTLKNKFYDMVMPTDKSRYWFADPVEFRFVFTDSTGKAQPPTSSGLVRLGLTYKSIKQYASGEYRCVLTSTGNTADVGSMHNFSGCVGYAGELPFAITVPVTYDLTPSVNASATTVAPGGTYAVTGAVANSAAITATNVSWDAKRIVYAPGASVPTAIAQPSTAGICAAYGPSSKCTALASGTRNFARGSTSVGNWSETANEPAGSRICYAVAVRPYKGSVDPGLWRYSVLDCVEVVSRPSVQVWGNDLRVGSALAGGTNRSSTVQALPASLSGKTYGSWGEYGVLAPGAVTGVASGSGLAPGNANGSQGSWSKLTFANTPTTSFGRFTTPLSMGTIPNIGAYLTKPGLKGVTLVNGGSTYTINASNVGSLSGGSKVLSVAGKVRITRDIIYPQATSGNSMNQLVIVAGAIDIDSSVGQIDAWLITPNGTINTCADVVGSLTTSLCNKRLQINGAMTARQVLLRRTAGAGQNDLKIPAEVLNLRGDAYIWARRISEQNGSWTTKAITELPPRY